MNDFMAPPAASGHQGPTHGVGFCRGPCGSSDQDDDARSAIMTKIIKGACCPEANVVKASGDLESSLFFRAAVSQHQAECHNANDVISVSAIVGLDDVLPLGKDGVDECDIRSIGHRMLLF
jgi:hypothetical protein